jgi:hypothetical protein
MLQWVEMQPAVFCLNLFLGMSVHAPLPCLAFPNTGRRTACYVVSEYVQVTTCTQVLDTSRCLQQ